MRPVLSLFLGFLFLLTSMSGAHAQLYESEVITDFESLITINRDASIEVTENITAKSLGYIIKHGIYRDLPAYYKDKSGKSHAVNLRILRVLRDNQPIKYTIENVDATKRIYLGSQNITLQPGSYTFSLTYKMEDQIGFSADYDQLYWNVTGNDWKLPIQRASTFITLPDNAPILKATGYTGRYGARDNHFTTEQKNKSSILFTTNHMLNPGEGLTVAVAWPKGIVIQPSLVQKTLSFLTSAFFHFISLFPFFTHGPILLFLTIFLLIHILLLFIFKYISSQAVVVPRFEPPKNMSPAMMNYAVSLFSDGGGEAFTATLVNMAVKKYLRIYEKDGKFCLVRTGDRMDALDQYEKLIAKKLFGSDNEILINDDTSNILADAFGRIRSDITRDHGLRKDKNKASTVIILIHLSLIPIALVIFAIHGLDLLLGCIGLAVFSPLFMKYLNGQTSSSFSAETMKQIEGFKMYLSTTEKARLNKLTRKSSLDLPLFEKYLPYAIALGVADSWIKKFAPIFSEYGNVDSSLVGGDASYLPVWYAADTWSTDLLPPFEKITSMVESISDNFTSTINDVFSSSSGYMGGGGLGSDSGGDFNDLSGGFGGGGCSGGGGGGGGGGGF